MIASGSLKIIKKWAHITPYFTVQIISHILHKKTKKKRQIIPETKGLRLFSHSYSDTKMKVKKHCKCHMGPFPVSPKA